MTRFPNRSVTTLAAASILLAAIGCGGSRGIDFDPELYRQQIEDLEAFIAKSESQRGDGGKISKLAAELSAAMARDIDNHRVKEGVTNRLISYGQYFADEEVRGGVVNMAEARQMWREIRDDLFAPADWFQ